MTLTAEKIEQAIIAAVSAETDNGPDAKHSLDCPVCGYEILWNCVIEWRVYPTYTVQIDCAGPCGFSKEVRL